MNEYLHILNANQKAINFYVLYKQKIVQIIFNSFFRYLNFFYYKISKVL